MVKKIVHTLVPYDEILALPLMLWFMKCQENASMEQDYQAH